MAAHPRCQPDRSLPQVIRAVVKPMKEAGRGSIINISSIEGCRHLLLLSYYTATKFTCGADQVHRSRA